MDKGSNCEGPAPGRGRASYGHRSGAPDSHLESASGTTAHIFYSACVQPHKPLDAGDAGLSHLLARLRKRPARRYMGPAPP